MLVTFLYLSGQSLSLLVYFTSNQIEKLRRKAVKKSEEDGCRIEGCDTNKEHENKANPSIVTTIAKGYAGLGATRLEKTSCTQDSDENKNKETISKIKLYTLKGRDLIKIGNARSQYKIIGNIRSSCNQKKSSIHDDIDEANQSCEKRNEISSELNNGNDISVSQIELSTRQHSCKIKLKDKHSPSYEEIITKSNKNEHHIKDDDEESGSYSIHLPWQNTKTSDGLEGSIHGLSEESENAIQWIHLIPWYLKPVIPALFNLCNAFMRWASLIYTPASIAEMIISGLELLFSVILSRIVRKKIVSINRWTGVIILSFGLIVVTFSHLKNPDDEEETDNSGRKIGITLLIGQCVMSALQDQAEELFMQASAFSPTLLLGMEGLFGLGMGSSVYLIFGAPSFKIDSENRFITFPPTSTPSFLNNETALNGSLQSLPLLSEKSSIDSNKMAYSCGLTLIFTLTGIFNIMGTGVTSSVTRNVWKNFRTILVWTIGLTIFYYSENNDLGEPWLIPNSFITLFGFSVMLFGVYVYYIVKAPKSLIVNSVAYERVIV